MNIIILGGAGYIGSALASHLLVDSNINSITLFDNLRTGNFGAFTNLTKSSDKIKFIEGDILDAHKLKKSLKNIDVVIHLASVTPDNEITDSHIYEQINHWGTSEVLNAIEQSEVKKIIYLSSAEIFSAGTIDNETADPNPSTFFGHSIYRAEEQIKRLWNKKNCIILRCAEIFGHSPSNQFKGLLNNFMFQSQFKGRIQIPGNGRNISSFSSITHLIQTIHQFIVQDTESDLFHFSEYKLQTLDLVETLQQIYPNLEFIFINPHLQLQDLAFTTSEKLNTFTKLKTNSLKYELEIYKSHFSF